MKNKELGEAKNIINTIETEDTNLLFLLSDIEDELNKEESRLNKVIDKLIKDKTKHQEFYNKELDLVKEYGIVVDDYGNIDKNSENFNLFIDKRGELYDEYSETVNELNQIHILKENEVKTKFKKIINKNDLPDKMNRDQFRIIKNFVNV